MQLDRYICRNSSGTWERWGPMRSRWTTSIVLLVISIVNSICRYLLDGEGALIIQPSWPSSFDMMLSLTLKTRVAEQEHSELLLQWFDYFLSNPVIVLKVDGPLRFRDLLESFAVNSGNERVRITNINRIYLSTSFTSCCAMDSG